MPGTGDTLGAGSRPREGDGCVAERLRSQPHARHRRARWIRHRLIVGRGRAEADRRLERERRRRGATPLARAQVRRRPVHAALGRPVSPTKCLPVAAAPVARPSLVVLRTLAMSHSCRPIERPVSSPKVSSSRPRARVARDVERRGERVARADGQHPPADHLRHLLVGGRARRSPPGRWPAGSASRSFAGRSRAQLLLVDDGRDAESRLLDEERLDRVRERRARAGRGSWRRRWRCPRARCRARCGSRAAATSKLPWCRSRLDHTQPIWASFSSSDMRSTRSSRRRSVGRAGSRYGWSPVAAGISDSSSHSGAAGARSGDAFAIPCAPLSALLATRRASGRRATLDRRARPPRRGARRGSTAAILGTARPRSGSARTHRCRISRRIWYSRSRGSRSANGTRACAELPGWRAAESRSAAQHAEAEQHRGPRSRRRRPVPGITERTAAMTKRAGASTARMASRAVRDAGRYPSQAGHRVTVHGRGRCATGKVPRGCVVVTALGGRSRVQDRRTERSGCERDRPGSLAGHSAPARETSAVFDLVVDFFWNTTSTGIPMRRSSFAQSTTSACRRIPSWPRRRPRCAAHRRRGRGCSRRCTHDERVRWFPPRQGAVHSCSSERHLRTGRWRGEGGGWAARRAALDREAAEPPRHAAEYGAPSSVIAGRGLSMV